MEQFSMALNLVRNKIKELRSEVPQKKFDKNKPAEIEINKFYLGGECVDRIMIVLRANGCEHYKKTGGCSMCSHFNGTMSNEKITSSNYIAQWNSVIAGTCLEDQNLNFSLDQYPIVCIYNLGSMLNPNEISYDALRYIFKSLNNYKSIKKVIIESRAEYVTKEVLEIIYESYRGIVEVGIGVESSNNIIRELCHSKGCENLQIIKDAVKTLHKFGYKALAYVNFKPCFLTEQESIEDAIKTSVDCFSWGFDAVSIEPTSLQEYALTNYLNVIGYYRVPWLWSLTKIIQGIYKHSSLNQMDIRIGGYFEEEILSGSQGEGFAGRNEIFPHQTSSNCAECSTEFIEKIKIFNMTYDIKVLENIKPCKKCYSFWEKCCEIKDSRSIPQRIIDIL